MTEDEAEVDLIGDRDGRPDPILADAHPDHDHARTDRRGRHHPVDHPGNPDAFEDDRTLRARRAQRIGHAVDAGPARQLAQPPMDPRPSS